MRDRQRRSRPYLPRWRPRSPLNGRRVRRGRLLPRRGWESRMTEHPHAGRSCWRKGRKKKPGRHDEKVQCRQARAPVLVAAMPLCRKTASAAIAARPYRNRLLLPAPTAAHHASPPIDSARIAAGPCRRCEGEDFPLHLIFIYRRGPFTSPVISSGTDDFMNPALAMGVQRVQPPAAGLAKTSLLPPLSPPPLPESGRGGGRGVERGYMGHIPNPLCGDEAPAAPIKAKTVRPSTRAAGEGREGAVGSKANPC